MGGRKEGHKHTKALCISACMTWQHMTNNGLGPTQKPTVLTEGPEGPQGSKGKDGRPGLRGKPGARGADGRPV